jgi:DNA polymerase
MAGIPAAVNSGRFLLPALFDHTAEARMSQGSRGKSRRGSRAAVQALESLARAGVTHLPKSKAKPPARSKATVAARAEPSVPAPKMPATPPPTPAAKKTPTAKSLNERVTALDVIRTEVAACQLCHELATTRTQTVFGVGNAKPRLVFMGEAPGADEDRQGEPFVGRAGQLLNKIIEACTMRREDVYILNTLKCRPPGNRNPLPDEAANCRGFLDRQLAVLQPEFICCLGAVAAQNLLGTPESIGRLRGRFHDYHGMRVLCTYHPAYLLRNPPAKKDCWQDMQILLAAMGIELPSRTGTT